MIETMRAFIALNLEIPAIRKVAAIQRSLRSGTAAPAAAVSWVSPPNMHITLRHLGEADPAIAPAIAAALKDILSTVPPLRVALSGPIAFPSAALARLITVDAEEPSGALQALAARVDQLAQELGFTPEPRSFQAHIILARLREGADVRSWFASIGTVNLGEARITECVLYRADLQRPGAEYRALGRFGLEMPASRSQRPSRAPRSQRPKKGRPEDAPANPAIPRPPKLPDMGAGAGHATSQDDKPKEQAPAAPNSTIDEGWGE